MGTKNRCHFCSKKGRNALDGPATFSDELNAKLNEIEDMNGISYKSIILYFYNNIARQVDETKTTRTLWIALDTMFLTKTLPNKIYLLEKLFNFRMDPGNDFEVNFSDFSTIVKSLVYNEKKFDDEGLVVILLNSFLILIKKSGMQ